jgi:hypothetical protein
MWKYLKREFFGWFAGFKDYISGLDSCELCGNEQSHYICVGCERRICYMCNSGYYTDAELCTDCRKDITPEELAEDRKDYANDLAEECTCPKTAWTGSEPNDSTCELDEEDHAYIAKYAVKEEK